MNTSLFFRKFPAKEKTMKNWEVVTSKSEKCEVPKERLERILETVESELKRIADHVDNDENEICVDGLGGILCKGTSTIRITERRKHDGYAFEAQTKYHQSFLYFLLLIIGIILCVIGCLGSCLALIITIILFITISCLFLSNKKKFNRTLADIFHKAVRECK